MIHEKSPYLLQHAENPVDWYPWGDEAFERARKEDKPIFLSIGYSTCHWCHVMERECFSNPDIAATLNRNFVSIKVDREERPDIDQIYMTFVQALTGQGGWPLNVFLTADREPFFGGTYFPAKTEPGLVSFPDVLARISQEWRHDRDRILDSANQITAYLKSMENSSRRGSKASEELLHSGFRAFRSSFDREHGGFGNSPKFPQASIFDFLLRYAWAFASKESLEMVEKTLREMARGGIYDHVGGGFHRYSTDARWFLPHFEKMLYDQAQLTRSYLAAYRLTGREELAEVARGTIDYVLRDLQHDPGGFYSAEDADSLPVAARASGEKREGAFYLWKASELESLLGKDFARFASIYGVKQEGNIQEDPFGEFAGQNILFLAGSEPNSNRIRWLGILRRARQERARPLLDDKILTAWNGLMISALARAFQTLGDPDYLAAARAAADFLLDNLYDSRSHSLSRHYRQGASSIGGFLEDYAFLTEGLLDLYESDLDSRWLLTAFDLSDKMVDLFWDSEEGGFFSSPEGVSTPLVRLKDSFDGAVPAGASVAASDLLRLSHLDPSRYPSILSRIFDSSAPDLEAAPSAQPRMLTALADHFERPVQIFIKGNRNDLDTRLLLETVFANAPPQRVIFLADGGPAQEVLRGKLPVLDSLVLLQGKATAYICEDYVCKLPTSDRSRVAALLQEYSLPVLKQD